MRGTAFETRRRSATARGDRTNSHAFDTFGLSSRDIVRGSDPRTMSVADVALRAEAGDEAANSPGLWHEVNLQFARDERAVAGKPSQQRLVEPDRTHPREPDRGGTPPKRAVDDVELVRGDHDVCALPLPYLNEQHDRGDG